MRKYNEYRITVNIIVIIVKYLGLPDSLPESKPNLSHLQEASEPAHMYALKPCTKKVNNNSSIYLKSLVI